MRKIFKYILSVIALLALPAIALAYQITVPSAPDQGYLLMSSTTGQYKTVAPGSNGTCLTSNGTIWLAGSCASGSLTGAGSPNTMSYWTSGSTLGATSSPTVGYITATSTTASQFPYASSTALTLTTLFDRLGLGGTVGQYLMSTGSAIQWVASTTLSTISGILSETKGGTNQSTYASGDTLYASGVNTLSKLSIGASSTVLTTNGTVPSWQKMFLSQFTNDAGFVTSSGVTAVTGTGEISSTGGNTPQISYTGVSTSSALSASGVLYAVDSVRKIATVATSSETCTAPLSCTAHDVLKGGGAITLGTVPVASGGTNGTSFVNLMPIWFNGTSLVSTSSVFTSGSFYATTTTANVFQNASTTNITTTGIASTTRQFISELGTPAGSFLAVNPQGQVISTTTSAGGVTAVTATWPVLSTGGNTPVISWGGLSTTSSLIAGTLITAANNTTGLTTVSTSTLSASSPLTGSFTQIGSGGSVGCQTASGSQNGCLSNLDYSAFNNKVSSTTSITAGAGLTGGGDLSTNRTLAIDFTRNNTWTGIQTLTNASTTNLSIGGTLVSTSTATSTFAAGLNITSGCFAVSGNCVGGTGGGSGTVTSITAGTNVTITEGSPCTTSCTINATGGGGSGGGTWSTTTSTVAGELVNYSNNTNDVVAVGGTSTTTAKFFVDPNLNGGTASTSVFVAGNGSATKPSFTFSSETGTGIYLNGAGILGFDLAGTNKANMSASNFNLGAISQITFANGTAAAPSIITGGFSNTGLFSTGNHDIGSSIAASERSRLTLYGFGIGTTTPKWSTEISSSTGSQLTLDDAANHLWSFRSSPDGILYIGTSSPTTYATSTPSVLAITQATTTFGGTGGINLTAGCFAVNSVCVGGSGGGSGTVTSVDMSVPTGLSISGNPVTTSGTLALGLQVGYNIPLTASTTQWSNLYLASTTLPYVTSITASAPLTGGVITTSGSIGCTTASSGVAGCLSNTAFDTFNNKQATLSATWPQILTGATLSFGGLSTSSVAVVGNLPYFSGVNTFANVATGTLSATGPITVTAGTSVVGGAATVACTTAANGVAGCLNSSDWATFNGKQAALSTPTWPIVLTGSTLSFGGLATTSNLVAGTLITAANGTNGLTTVATTSIGCSGFITCTGFNALGSASTITTTGTLTTANGGTNHGNFTAGSVVFAGSGGTSLTENNSNFFWNNAATALSLGTTTYAGSELLVSSSTGPQLILSNNLSGFWGGRVATDGIYYFGTTTSSGATSTPSILTMGQATTTFATDLKVGASATASTSFMVDQYGHVMSGGAVPTCGTSCVTVAGDDNNMVVVTGSSVSNATVNFANTWRNAAGTAITPNCVASEENAGTVAVDASSTPTTVVLEFASALTSINISVQCMASLNFLK